jgi:streptogramin lyase
MLRSVAISSFSLLTISTLSCVTTSAATLYAADFGWGQIDKVDTVTGQVTKINTIATSTSSSPAAIHAPVGLTFDQNGILWETELNNGIRKIDLTTGTVTNFVIMDQSGQAIDPNFHHVTGLAFDKSGTLWESGTVGWGADSYSEINKIDPNTGIATVFATTGTNGNGLIAPSSLAFDRNGELWVADIGSGIKKINTSTGVVTPFLTNGSLGGGLYKPAGIAFDSNGTLWEMNYTGGGSSALNKIDITTGVVTGFSSFGSDGLTGNGFSHPYGIAFAPATISGNNTISANDTAAVPEPFTIVGTLIGGTTAMRMRKKLKNANKA